MLYGFHEGNTTILVAASTTAELEDYVANAPDSADLEELDTLTMLMNDQYRGLKVAYRARRSGIEISEVPTLRAADLQRMMYAKDGDDIYAKGSLENRTIAEITGLDKHDPYDNRTDEEREEDSKMRKMEDDFRKKNKNGGLSGDSFSPTPRGEDKVSVRQINGSIDDKTGKITIDDVLAEKGLWSKREEPLVATPGDYWQVTITGSLLGNSSADILRDANGTYSPVYQRDTDDLEAIYLFGDQTEADAFADEARSIMVHVATVGVDKVNEFGISVNPMRIESTTFKKLYRVDTHGVTAEQFDALVAQVPMLELDKLIVARGLFDEDGSTGVWTASGMQRLAEKIDESLRAIDPSIVTEVYAINRENERLVPKGVQVVDTDAPREIGPRPWNDRAAEWHAWTDEQREKEIKENIKGDEFYYAGSNGTPDRKYVTTVAIVPKDYFAREGRLWGETLPIGHLIPKDMKELEPGFYEDRNREYNIASHTIGQKGMRESARLQIYLNGL